MDLGGVPDSARDLTVFAFSDLGSWAMYATPSPGDQDAAGSIPGPFLLSEGGLWLSPSLVRLVLESEGEPMSLSWVPEGDATSGSFPGFLRQDLVAGPLRVRLELGFARSDAAILVGRIRNTGGDSVELEAHWVGGPFFLNTEVRGTDEGVVLTVASSGTRIRLSPLESGEWSVETRSFGGADAGAGPESGFALSAAPVTLGPGQELRYSLLLQLRMGREGVAVGGDPAPGAGTPEGANLQPELVLEAVRGRWSEYLSRTLGPRGDSGNPMPRGDQRVAVKAIQTLLSNWRSPLGGLRHDGLFPSYAYRGFHGVWSWDSWKHARALALFAPELAKDQIRVMLDHQDPNGMVPDVIYVDSAENNWRDTKPPLTAWAVAGIFRSTADTAFVAEVLPALDRYHRWWYRYRDHDGNGLCEYGSTDGTRIAAAWESGMDNAVRFDEAVMVRNGPEAWSLNQESVDLNSYLYAEKGYLAELFALVGQEERAGSLRAEARDLAGLIRDTFFDEETGYFHDVELESKAHIRVQGPEGWIPLWAGVASTAQAAAVAGVMTDPDKFAGHVPLPTLAMDHPAFDPADGYWRGPVWLDQAYFGIHGLARYGYQDEAGELARRVLENARGLLEDGPVFENYHPVTGAGLNAPHFSWSAAHLLMLFHEGLFAAESSQGGQP